MARPRSSQTKNARTTKSATGLAIPKLKGTGGGEITTLTESFYNKLVKAMRDSTPKQHQRLATAFRNWSEKYAAGIERAIGTGSRGRAMEAGAEGG